MFYLCYCCLELNDDDDVDADGGLMNLLCHVHVDDDGVCLHCCEMLETFYHRCHDRLMMVNHSIYLFFLESFRIKFVNY